MVVARLSINLRGGQNISIAIKSAADELAPIGKECRGVAAACTAQRAGDR